LSTAKRGDIGFTDGMLPSGSFCSAGSPKHRVAKYLRHSTRTVNEVPILPRFVDECAARADRDGGV